MTDKKEQNDPASVPETPISAKRSSSISKVTLILSIALALVIGVIIGARGEEFLAKVPFIEIGSSQELDLSTVQQTYDSLEQHYAGELDRDTLIEGANRGLVDAAGDAHTTYFSSEEAEEFMNGLEGTFSGIGAELGTRDDRVTVITTLDDSPAEASGLKADDVIVKVNDEDATSWSLDKAVSEIRGEKGTTVKLTVLRDNGTKEISITRDTITDPSVKTEVKDGIGIMRISRFSEGDTVQLARQAAKDFADRDVDGIVLDVRGNGGGYLQAAVDVASLWLNDAVVVTERRDGEVVDTLRTNGSATLEGIPTVVLIDGGSASASEILAGALRDNDAAHLLGAQTYGKGSVQQIVDLAFGAKLKVTVANWFTPGGKNIEEEGIAPDTEVKYDQENDDDVQLEKALQRLREE